MFKEGNAVWVGKSVIGNIERMLMPDVFVISLLPGKRLVSGDTNIDIVLDDGKTTANVRVYPFEANKVKVVVLVSDVKKNRRKNTRYTIHDKHEVFIGSREEPGYLIDISCGGVRCSYKYPLVLGKRVHMRIVIDEKVVIEETGDVVGQFIKQDGFWYNIKFIERLPDAVVNMVTKLQE